MQANDKAMIAVFGAVGALLFWIAWSSNGRGAIPKYDTPATMASLNYVPHLDTGSHYFHPAYCAPGQTVNFMAHRYPRVSGGNISTLIHRGMDALKEPSPYDNSWRVMPPGEVMW